MSENESSQEHDAVDAAWPDGVFDQFRLMGSGPQRFFSLMPLTGWSDAIAFIAIVFAGQSLGDALVMRDFSMVPLMMAGGFICNFFFVVAAHYLSRLFGGVGTLQGTFRALAYASVLSIFAWVPRAAMQVAPKSTGSAASVCFLYLVLIGCTIYMMILAVQRSQSLSRAKAALVVVLVMALASIYWLTMLSLLSR